MSAPQQLNGLCEDFSRSLTFYISGVATGSSADATEEVEAMPCRSMDDTKVEEQKEGWYIVF